MLSRLTGCVNTGPGRGSVSHHLICCVCLCVSVCVRPFTFFAYKKDVISLFFCHLYLRKIQRFFFLPYGQFLIWHAISTNIFCGATNFFRYEGSLLLKKFVLGPKNSLQQKKANCCSNVFFLGT